MIELTNSGDVEFARQNRNFNMDRMHASNKTKGKKFTLNFSRANKNIYVIPLTKLGIVHRLPAPMHDSLLIMAHNVIPHKARRDALRLKAKRTRKSKRMNLPCKLIWRNLVRNMLKYCFNRTSVLM